MKCTLYTGCLKKEYAADNEIKANQNWVSDLKKFRDGTILHREIFCLF